MSGKDLGPDRVYRDMAELAGLVVKLRVLADLFQGIIVFSFFGLYAGGYWLIIYSLSSLISKSVHWGAVILLFFLVMFMLSGIVFTTPLAKASYDPGKASQVASMLVASLAFVTAMFILPLLARHGYLSHPGYNWALALGVYLLAQYRLYEAGRNKHPPYSVVTTHSLLISGLLTLLSYSLGGLVYTWLGETPAALFVLGGVLLSYLASLLHLARRTSLLWKEELDIIIKSA